MKLSLRELFLEKKKIPAPTKRKLTLESAYFAPEARGLKEKLEDDILKPGDEATLSSLESEIELAINKSVDLEEQSTLTLDEKMSAGGFAYESEVIKALMAAKAAGNIKKGAGASAAASDADMNIFGKVFDVEIKLNKNAQMGGSSVRYNPAGGINLVASLEEDTEALLIKAVRSKKKDINDLLNFLAEQDPDSVNQSAVKFPMTCTRKAWDAATKAGKLVNTQIPLDASFIAKHYAKKGIFYIQIGGAGLFYLSKNPANLPIPKLEGKVVVEVRSARSGTKKLKSGIGVVAGGIRVQGRLKAKNTSPYTIDDPDSIKKMLSVVDNKKKKRNSKKKKQTAATAKSTSREEIPRSARPKNVGATPF